MTCTYCHKNPGAKDNGLWKGFRDMDTGQLVCWKCQARHYREKNKTEHAHLHSEFPVQAVHQLDLL